MSKKSSLYLFKSRRINKHEKQSRLITLREEILAGSNFGGFVKNPPKSAKLTSRQNYHFLPSAKKCFGFRQLSSSIYHTVDYRYFEHRAISSLFKISQFQQYICHFVVLFPLSGYFWKFISFNPPN